MVPPAGDFTCREFVELVTAYLDGALSAEQVATLDEHLAICEGCESVLDQFRVVVRMSGSLHESDVDALTPSQRERVMAAFRTWAAERT